MLLCLDFDGVVVDSLEQQLRIVSTAQAQLGRGRAPTREDFRSIEDLTYEGFARHIGIPGELIDRWRELILGQLLAEDPSVSLFEGMSEVLSELGSRFPLVLITSNVQEAVERVLSKHQLTHAIEGILDGRARGTKADKIKLASQKFGIPLSSTYLIGDTRSDMRHARSVGAVPIGVAWGYQPAEALTKEGAQFIAAIPRELLSFFGTLEVH